MHSDPLGQGQANGLSGVETPDLGPEGVERAGNDRGLRRTRAVAVDDRADAIAPVADVAAIDLGRLGQGLAAPQGFDDEGVAALGQGIGAEVGGDQQGVSVQPFEAMLALGQDEAVLDPQARAGVELAHHHRILAAVRERDQAAGLVGRQAVGTLPHPVPALRAGQGIDVEQGFPLGVRRPVGGQSRAAPDALGIARVLPEIADAVAQEAGARDAVGGGQDRLGLGAQGLVTGIAGQGGQRLAVLLGHEGHGLCAVDLFQRQMVVDGTNAGGGQVGGGVRRPRRLDHHDRIIIERHHARRVGDRPSGTGGEQQGRCGSGQEQAAHGFTPSISSSRTPQAIRDHRKRRCVPRSRIAASPLPG